MNKMSQATYGLIITKLFQNVLASYENINNKLLLAIASVTFILPFILRIFLRADFRVSMGEQIKIQQSHIKQCWDLLNSLIVGNFSSYLSEEDPKSRRTIIMIMCC